MPPAGEMHQIPLNKVAEIIGADAVMFITLEQYGNRSDTGDSSTIVRVAAKLVDTKTGILLWQGEGSAEDDSGGLGNMFNDVVASALTHAAPSAIDRAP